MPPPGVRSPLRPPGATLNSPGLWAAPRRPYREWFVTVLLGVVIGGQRWPMYGPLAQVLRSL
jgi:hypothetical protein